jgi:hypothetical protein
MTERRRFIATASGEVAAARVRDAPQRHRAAESSGECPRVSRGAHQPGAADRLGKVVER